MVYDNLSENTLSTMSMVLVQGANLRSFNAESMFSQVGGFIGIMVGVSLFHIPDILTSMISKSKAIYRKRTSNYNLDDTKISNRNSRSKLVSKQKIQYGSKV